MCWLLLAILLRRSSSASNNSSGCCMAGQITETFRRAAGLSFLDWLYLAIAVKELLIARIRYATRTVGKILRKLQDERLACEGETGGRTCAAPVMGNRCGGGQGSLALRLSAAGDGGRSMAAALPIAPGLFSWCCEELDWIARVPRVASFRQFRGDRRKWRGLHCADGATCPLGA